MHRPVDRVHEDCRTGTESRWIGTSASTCASTDDTQWREFNPRPRSCFTLRDYVWRDSQCDNRDADDIFVRIETMLRSIKMTCHIQNVRSIKKVNKIYFNIKCQWHLKLSHASWYSTPIERYCNYNYNKIINVICLKIINISIFIIITAIILVIIILI